MSRCPNCSAKEVPASTPWTVYEFGWLTAIIATLLIGASIGSIIVQLATP